MKLPNNFDLTGCLQLIDTRSCQQLKNVYCCNEKVVVREEKLASTIVMPLMPDQRSIPTWNALASSYTALYLRDLLTWKFSSSYLRNFAIPLTSDSFD